MGDASVTFAGVLAALGGLVIAGIIIKGFWSGNRVKPIDQPDDWQKHTGGDV
jgi:hypothetical protein